MPPRKKEPEDLAAKKALALEVIARLKKEYPDAGCTLDYDHAWQLLVSVRLAAQCTDARVNIVVEDLFAKYPNVAALAAAEPEEAESGARKVAVPVGAVLGEVINHDVQTLADTIAPRRDMASELRRGEPVADLRNAIGINDKFLLIRDLFGGDGEAYEEAIATLNAFDDFDECMIHIAENYAWNPNSDGAKFMMELLERKFA